MELNAKQDIDVPIDFVYASMVDFSAHERRATAAGYTLKRDVAGPEVWSWSVRFEWRGRLRDLQFSAGDFQKPEHFALSGKSENIDLYVDVKLIRLAPSLTRVRLKMSLKGKSLKARLMIQSARLAKKTVIKRLASRMRGVAREIEFDYLQACRRDAELRSRVDA
ncbi:MAG: SRPBCC family protein [Pseudomonadota bacterium]